MPTRRGGWAFGVTCAFLFRRRSTRPLAISTYVQAAARPAVGGEVAGWGARDNYQAPGGGAPLDYISDLWVSPDAQGRGIGSAILNELMDRMRAEGLKRAQIEVAQANLRALDLYVRQGFRETWRGVKMSETLGLPLPRILLERPL